MKIRTLIIDDEPIALEKLRSYVDKVPFLELCGACRNGVEAAGFLSSHEVDVIFTDINMPDMTGMELAGSLVNPPMIVFITAYADYAVESYKMSAVDYLLKPFSFADFQRAANKVLSLYSMRMSKDNEREPDPSAASNGESIFVKVDYRYVRVSLADIRYIKGYGEYLQIFTTKDTSPLVTLSSFNAIKEKLPANFVQVHRSYIVNMDAIQSVVKGRIVMDADTYIPIGDSYRNGFYDYLSAYSVGAVQKKQSGSLDV